MMAAANLRKKVRESAAKSTMRIGTLCSGEMCLPKIYATNIGLFSMMMEVSQHFHALSVACPSFVTVTVKKNG